MLGIRVVVTAEDSRERKKIKDTLTQDGYNVVAEFRDGKSLLTSIYKLQPHLIIVEDNIIFSSGLELAKVLHDYANCPLLIFINPLALERLKLLGEEWIFPLVSKPIEEHILVKAVENTLSNYEELSKLQKSLSFLTRPEAQKQLVTRAKAILMEKHDISEQEAYREIQKVSMSKRKPKHIIAEAIILSYIYCYDEMLSANIKNSLL